MEECLWYLIFIIIILIIFYICIIFKLYDNFENSSTPFNIDVVYTWSGECTGNDNIRTRYNEELKYSLRSIYFNMPWVNHIFILMNPPLIKPSWFGKNSYKYVTVIDQTSTFPYKNDTPNTNSFAIETTLHRIPGLSEHVIYFNDDFFTGRPVPFTTFFTQSGKPILTSLFKNLKNKKGRIAFEGTSKSIKLPPSIDVFNPHIPFPFLKSEMYILEKEYINVFKWIRSQKIRIGIGENLCKEAGISPTPCILW